MQAFPTAFVAGAVTAYRVAKLPPITATHRAHLIQTKAAAELVARSFSKPATSSFRSGYPRNHLYGRTNTPNALHSLLCHHPTCILQVMIAALFSMIASIRLEHAHRVLREHSSTADK
eukprot:scpid96840/ scgid11023/ 